MKKQMKRAQDIDSRQLGGVTAGVVPIVLGRTTFDASALQATSELSLTTVEQQR